MGDSDDSTHAPFDRDVEANRGYLYTTDASLSSRLANERLTLAALATVELGGRRVLDVGCGDGTYTEALVDRARPSAMTAIDPASTAIAAAVDRRGDRRIDYEVADATRLPYVDDAFDIAHLRGVLHHLDDPLAALRESLRVAPTLIVIEPNGYNPILKLLERFSSYHVEHGEQSFTSRRLDRWFAQAGGRTVSRRWAGLVPFFCPDWLARSTKAVEPIVERLPGVAQLSCAVYVARVERTAGA